MIKFKKVILSNEENERFKILKEKKIHPLIAKHLAIKFDNLDTLELFLNPKLENLDDVSKIKDIKKGTQLILDKIINKEDKEILVVGDYDTDGITSSALLFWFFKEKFNIELDCYIPEREEGYGISKNIIDYAINNNKNFIITVDNGISAFEAISYAKEKNLTVIITDHHQIQNNTIPPADAVLNTVQPDCKFRDKYLSGVGIAWCMCYYIDNNIAKHLLPIAAIGTIADVVPLINDNRIIVIEGLKTKIDKKFLGIHKLIENANILSNISSMDVGFKIAPLINSAGREGYAKKAFEFLIETDENKINELFKFIKDCDRLRKEEQKRIEKDIEERLTVQNNDTCICIKPDSYIYNPSVVGIVGSKLVEKYNLPTLIFSETEIIENKKKKIVYTGSGRGVSWFNFSSFIEKLKEKNIIIKGGGHKLAAGLSLHKHKFNELKELFEIESRKVFKKENYIDIIESIELPEDSYDSKKILREIFKETRILEPIGASNEFPKFTFKIGMVNETKLIGKEEPKKHFIAKTSNGITINAWGKVENGVIPDISYKEILSDIVMNEFETKYGDIIQNLILSLKKYEN